MESVSSFCPRCGARTHGGEFCPNCQTRLPDSHGKTSLSRKKQDSNGLTGKAPRTRQTEGGGIQKRKDRTADDGKRSAKEAGQTADEPSSKASGDRTGKIIMTAVLFAVALVLAFTLGPNPKILGVKLSIVAFCIYRAIWGKF